MRYAKHSGVQRMSFRAVFILLLCASLALPGSPPVFAQNPIPSDQIRVDFQNLDFKQTWWDQYGPGLLDQWKETTDHAEKFETIFAELLVLARDAQKLAENRLQELLIASKGNETAANVEFKKELDSGKFKVVSSAVGEAQLTNVEGHVIIRMIHKDSDGAFAVFADTVPRGEHFKRWKARQLLFSGSSRANGEMGRDLTLVFSNSEGLERAEFEKKPSPFGSEFSKWLKTYWEGIYLKPTQGDKWVNGAVAGGFQLVLTLGLTYLKTLQDPGYEFELVPGAWTILFGVTLGVFKSTQKNWFQIGSLHTPTKNIFKRYTVKAFSKSAAVSLIYSVPLTAWTLGMEAFNFFEPTGWITSGRLLVNAAAHNFAKSGWYMVPTIREDSRKNTNVFNVDIPLIRDDDGGPLKVKQASIEHIMIYLLPFALSRLDIFLMNSYVVGIPAGWISLLASLYIGKYVAYRVANHYNHKNKDTIRAEWEWISLQRPARITFAWAQEALKGMDTWIRNPISISSPLMSNESMRGFPCHGFF